MSEPQGPRPGLRIVEEKHGRRDVTIPHLPGIPELTLWEETLGQECPRPHWFCSCCERTCHQQSPWDPQGLVRWALSLNKKVKERCKVQDCENMVWSHLCVWIKNTCRRPTRCLPTRDLEGNTSAKDSGYLSVGATEWGWTGMEGGLLKMFESFEYD